MRESHMNPGSAKELCNAVASRVVARLRRTTKDRQTADGAHASLWEEMCVQARGGPFFLWEASLDEARELIRGEFAQLDGHAKDPLWVEIKAWMDVHGCEGAARRA